MPQPTGFYVRLGWSGWLTLVVVLGLILAIAAVVAVLILGAFVILLPVILAAGLLYYLFPSLWRPKRTSPTDIIEGEYRIVDPRRLEHDLPPDDRS